MRDLLDAWSAHVRRIADEMEGEDDPDFAWGAYDYAALLIRSSIHAARPNMSERAVRSLDVETASPDDHFRSVTEPDVRGIFVDLIHSTLGKLPPDREWWWSRIPIRGPARLDIESLCNGSDRS